MLWTRYFSSHDPVKAYVKAGYVSSEEEARRKRSSQCLSLVSSYPIVLKTIYAELSFISNYIKNSTKRIPHLNHKNYIDSSQSVGLKRY